ncbi:TetR/AcrR family transcriptional regulator [Paeniglutamicibacter sp. NPDC012692]|uniref:TetR/AcrR family transcriptional regulator n=1 Tax=Paeniglutamicibacter sp. NPDC012692 TaxID=3364388 RepID=UPI0036B883EF
MANDTRKRILEACSICIARDGVRGMRVQDVCKQAGISTGLVYYHFTDRDGLLAATLEYVNMDSVAQREEPAAGGSEPYELLRELLLAEIQDDESVRAKSIVWNEIKAIAVFEPPLAEHLAASTSAWQSHVAKLVSGHTGAGIEQCQEAALLLTSLVEGLSSRWLSNQLDTAAARAALERGLESVLPAKG